LLVASLPAEGAGSRLLDVGCAGGYLSSIFAARGYQVTGLERSGGAGPDFPANVRLIEHDLEAGLPDLDGRFDYILCADILEHMREPSRLLSELRGVLAPGGKLVASLPNSGNLYFRLNVLLGRFPKEEKGLFDRTHLHFYMWKNWLSLFTGSGFRIEETRPTGIPVGLAVPAYKNSAPVRAAEALAYGCARAWRTLFAYQFIVVSSPAVQ
jgi:SAM-dependent methyltransferase